MFPTQVSADSITLLPLFPLETEQPVTCLSRYTHKTLEKSSIL